MPRLREVWLTLWPVRSNSRRIVSAATCCSAEADVRCAGGNSRYFEPAPGRTFFAGLTGSYRF